MYGYVGWALHRTVNYLVQTKWKEHPLKKRGLFAIHTKVLICVNGSPGNPWTLILNFIWYSNCNWGRKHFLEVRKGKGIYLTMATGQIKTFAGVPSPGSVQEGGRICKPEPSLVSSEMGFGESKYSYALHHLSLCYCFCRSVLLPKITERGWKEERNKGVNGVLAIIVVIIMANPLLFTGFYGS